MISVLKAVAHPWQCDVLGHLTTRFYMAVFDDASYHFLAAVCGWAGNTDPEGRLGWADVRHEIDYQAEVSAGELLEVRAELLKLGGKSITAVYEMHHPGEAAVLARLQSTSVLFDLEARRAVTIGEELRARAQGHLRSAEPAA